MIAFHHPRDKGAPLGEDRAQAIVSPPAGKELSREAIRERGLAWLASLPNLASFVDPDLDFGPSENNRTSRGTYSSIWVDPAGSGDFYKTLNTSVFRESANGVEPPRLADLHDLLILAEHRDLGFAGAIPKLDAVGVNRNLRITYRMHGLAGAYHLRDERFQELPPARQLRMLVKLAEHIELIHERGLVHNDIKARNLLTNGWNGLLIDFGLAKQNGEFQTEGNHRVAGEGYGCWSGTDNDVYSFARTIEEGVQRGWIHPTVARAPGLKEMLSAATELVTPDRSQRSFQTMGQFLASLKGLRL